MIRLSKLMADSNREFFLSQANQLTDKALKCYECVDTTIMIANGRHMERECGKCFSCICQEVLKKRAIKTNE